jgi:glyoxalase family protein
MTPTLDGIHHVTAIAGDPQANFDFYAGALGLRLIKRTINFDDPGTYHLYYGDGVGSPGTILTFFPWPGAARGRVGSGQVSAFALSVPPTALPFWRSRLTEYSIPFADGEPRFGASALTLQDPHGLPLEIVASSLLDPRPGWTNGPVPAEYAIRGVESVTLSLADPTRTDLLLTNLLGFRTLGSEGARTRYALADGQPGALVDVLHTPSLAAGASGAGTVHHVAFRTQNDDQQELWLAAPVSPVRDRQYFHSLYFHEPGRVLFEIATDTPGFATDEDVAHLGETLCLPPWLEPQRALVESTLPPLNTTR